MKKLFLGLIMVSWSLTSIAEISPRQWCEETSQMAKTVMEIRQKGEPKENLSTFVNGDKFFEALVDRTYEEPIATNDKREYVIDSWAKNRYDVCYKHMLSKGYVMK